MKTAEIAFPATYAVGSEQYPNRRRTVEAGWTRGHRGKPTRGTGVLIAAPHDPKNWDALEALTTEQLLAAFRGELPLGTFGISFEAISAGQVRKLWSEHTAAQEAERAARREREQQEAARLVVAKEQAANLRARLEALGLETTEYRTSTKIAVRPSIVELSLDQMNALLDLLGASK